MTGPAPAIVYFHPLPDGQGPGLDHALVTAAIARVMPRLGLRAAAAEDWGLRVELGKPGRPPEISPLWAAAAAGTLDGAHGHPFDTLSINVEGLHTAPAQLAAAAAQGYGDQYRVADDPAAGTTGDDPAGLAAFAGQVQGMLVLSSIRPHPHLGFLGAVSGLGLGLANRQAKLEMHRDIRPRVDTPLCAGCGACLSVCIFDAIVIKAGRATIDHRKCTGCGECMTVCHMAGISAEDQERLPAFQERVAAAGAAFRGQAPWGRPGKLGFLTFLVQLNRWQGRSRNRLGPGRRHLGILASLDPVAADKAAWDLLAEAHDGRLGNWTGYRQDPAPLLGRAEELGLGNREYRLVRLD